MRNISFFLTQRQIREKTKTVTRRLGWTWLKVGTLLQPVVKGQGIPKGGKVKKIGGPIRVTRRWIERLDMLSGTTYGKEECIKEGFPNMTPEEFVKIFCTHNKCQPGETVTRIEFEYL